RRLFMADQTMAGPKMAIVEFCSGSYKTVLGVSYQALRRSATTPKRACAPVTDRLRPWEKSLRPRFPSPSKPFPDREMFRPRMYRRQPFRSHPGEAGLAAPDPDIFSAAPSACSGAYRNPSPAKASELREQMFPS